MGIWLSILILWQINFEKTLHTIQILCVSQMSMGPTFLTRQKAMAGNNSLTRYPTSIFRLTQRRSSDFVGLSRNTACNNIKGPNHCNRLNSSLQQLMMKYSNMKIEPKGSAGEKGFFYMLWQGSVMRCNSTTALDLCLSISSVCVKVQRSYPKTNPQQ